MLRSHRKAPAQQTSARRAPAQTPTERMEELPIADAAEPSSILAEAERVLTPSEPVDGGGEPDDPFADVTIVPSSDLAVARNVMAVTVGTEVHMSPMASTPSGQVSAALLRHELTHVVPGFDFEPCVETLAFRFKKAFEDDPWVDVEGTLEQWWQDYGDY